MDWNIDFRVYSQMFDLSDSSSNLLIPFQGATQLDMNVSCLFMHEVNISSPFKQCLQINFSFQLRHKYKRGEYEELQQIIEHPQC